MDERVIARFWAKVDIRGPNECWPWTGSKDRYGYGQYGSKKCKSGRWIASRFAWTVTNGPIPDGVEVLHSCDDPPCCNPACLFLGTQADNMLDMHAKRRHRAGPRKPYKPRRAAASHGYRRGTQQPSAKLDERGVVELRRLRAEGWTWKALSERFGIAPRTAEMVGKRLRWKHVD
jgi:hypothetical protein